MCLCDNSICSLCDKQHTTKQCLSENHMRHAPLLVAIYSKRQSLCHLGAYVIRKMTPSKTQLPGRQLQLCAVFFLFSLSFSFFLRMFWFWDLFGVFHQDVKWQKSVSVTRKQRWFLWSLGFYRGLFLPSLSSGLTRFPHLKCGLCLILAMQKPEQSRVVCQTPSPVASWMVLIYSPRKTILHLLLVLGMASSFTNQASSVSESVHVLAVGQFYGLLPWQSMWHAEQDCFL